ncbi:MAG: N-acetyltransferase [Deltaproteobacteria bacterium]|nr:MAG: N-acetyltransferase [Deltaproteobacteria bacterium]
MTRAIRRPKSCPQLFVASGPAVSSSAPLAACWQSVPVTDITIAAATAEVLTPLAAALAPDPLFVRYGRTAAALAAQWRAAQAAGDGLLVAHKAGAPAGLAWYAPSGAFATGAYLRLLAVSPVLQGQAIGAALLAAFETQCSLASRKSGWFLLCSAANAPARAFYRRQGYKEVGQLPGFVLPDVVEVIYWKAPPGTVADAAGG